MNRFGGDMRNANSAVETLNAAANAIAMAEARAPENASQLRKKRWSSWLRSYWCFRPQKYNKRIGRSILVPEPSSTVTEPPARNLILPTPMGAHFAAPPSSPASFNPSEPPSASQSPAGLLSFASISANIHSSDGPRSIFAIGPYAHETQLVSPPTFSTYTTEPSTAPFTPPPESVHMTTPSSPEVPFAQLVDLTPRSSYSSRFQYDYQAYQYYPGSPAGQLISPGSIISGSDTSSPLPDHELFYGGRYNHDIRFGFPPALLNLHLLPTWGSGQGSGSFTPDPVLVHHQSTADSVTDENDNQESLSQRVSFEDVVRCLEKEVVDNDENDRQKHMEDAKQKPQPPSNYEEGQRCQRPRSASLGSIKEFNFDNVNREPQKPCLGPNWWTNDTVTEQPTKNWSFFPVAQPGANFL